MGALFRQISEAAQARARARRQAEAEENSTSSRTARRRVDPAERRALQEAASLFEDALTPQEEFARAQRRLRDLTPQLTTVIMQQHAEMGVMLTRTQAAARAQTILGDEIGRLRLEMEEAILAADPVAQAFQGHRPNRQ